MYFGTAPFPITDSQIRHWQIGNLELWVRHSVNDEWLVAYRHSEGTDDALVEAEKLAVDPPGLQWQRFAVPEAAQSLSLSPHMPDRPIIVRPETPLNLTTGGEGVFYALLPCWIRLTVGEATKLLEIPSVRLSNSWFGEPISGVLCYAMRTHARRTIDDLPCRPHRAVCTLRLRNQNSEPLEFKRVCLQVEPLVIFQGSKHLWTSEISMTYQGSDRFSDQLFGQNPPAGDPAAKLLTPAREEHDTKGFMSRFKVVKSLIY